MRITRDLLLKVARDTATQRAKQERDLLCIYLTGSLLLDEPLLGGTADIDLVCVHNSTPPVEREIVRMTDEIHLDIAHYPETHYRQPRRLRLNPWLGGYLIENPILLYELQHWFEFTQASVAAQYNQPENVLGRAQPLVAAARQTWMELQMSGGQPGPEQVWSLLKALEQAANAVAVLSGVPLVERRFLLSFPHRAAAVGRPELTAGLADLLTGGRAEELSPAWAGWMTGWQAALARCGETALCPPRLHPARRAYYLRAAAALWDEMPSAAVWIALRTWTLAVKSSGEPDPAWQSALNDLGLADASGWEERLQHLDRFLDQVEETLDIWGHQNGL
jgi:hypothetical protein